MSRPHIGIFEASDGPSGVSRYVQSLLNGIDPAEFDVTVFGHPRGPYRASATNHMVHLPAGAKVETTTTVAEPSESRPSMIGAVRSSWRNLAPAPVRLWAGFGRECLGLSKLFRKHPVDLLHAQIVSSEQGVVGARLAGVPQVLGTLHIDSSQSAARHWVLESVTNHCLHRVIAVSDSTRTDWIRRTGLPPRQVMSIPNGIDPRKFDRKQDRGAARRQLGLPDDGRPLVVAVGRLMVQKGYRFLLDAVARLAGRFPGLTVAIAGDGAMRQSLTDQARTLAIADRVHFLGFQSDVQPVLDAADMFALPSLWEALPYSLLEAMAAGLPVVGTKVAGVPEVIVHGETGYLIPPRDLDSLADAMALLLESPVSRQRMGEAGRERVTQAFHERTTVSRTVDVYRQMLRRVPAQSSSLRQAI